MVIIIFAGLSLALFFGAFISKRRFGLLGLALTAGATLSTLWSYEAGLLVSSFGFVPDGPIANAVTLSSVVLLPPLVLLFHGYSYKNKIGRFIGSLLFTLLALAFLIEPIGYALVLEGNEAAIYKTMLEYKGLVISVGVVLAIVDLFFTKPASLAPKKRH